MDQNELERALVNEETTPLLNTSHNTFTAQEAEVKKYFKLHMLSLSERAKRMAERYSDDDYDYMDGALLLANGLLSADYDGDMQGLVDTVNMGGPPWGESTTPEVCEWLYSLPGVTVTE